MREKENGKRMLMGEKQERLLRRRWRRDEGLEKSRI